MSKSTPLRESARGQECMMRLGGICNHDNDTVVLCHANGSFNLGGKSADLHAAFCCSSCHDEVDRRTRKRDSELVMEYFKEAIFRTQQWWIDNGYLTWKGAEIRRKDALATERLAVWVKRMASKLL